MRGNSRQQGGTIMHAIIRTYSGGGAKKFFDFAQTRKSEIEQVMRAVPGFISFTAFETADGGATVTVCNDKAGTDESARVAREWIAKNAGDIGVSPPSVTEGSVVLHAK
jgi:hypothetical protein